MQNKLNVFIVNVMPSGTGKSTSTKVVHESFIRAASLVKRSIPGFTGWCSGGTIPGMKEAITASQGTLVWVADEFFSGVGRFIEQTDLPDRAEVLSLMCGDVATKTALKTSTGPSIDTCTVSGFSTVQVCCGIDSAPTPHTHTNAHTHLHSAARSDHLAMCVHADTHFTIEGCRQWRKHPG